MIIMPTALTAPHEFEALTGRYVLRALLGAANVLQEQCRPHAESGR
jgi:hypothetical protein